MSNQLVSPCLDCQFSIKVFEAAGTPDTYGRVACDAPPFESHAERLWMAAALREKSPEGVNKTGFLLAAEGVGTLLSAWPVRYIPRHVTRCTQQHPHQKHTNTPDPIGDSN